MFCQASSSNIFPAINFVASPKSINKERMKKLIVASPNAPSCINSTMIDCPNRVKEEIGMVKRPVIQVAEVDAKSTSIKGIGATCEIGNDNKMAPKLIKQKKDNKINRDGEKCATILLLINKNLHPCYRYHISN